jgi:ribonuclease E
VLNHKRAHLRELEERFRITITVTADPSMAGQQPFAIERGEQIHSVEQARAIANQPSAIVAAVEYEDTEEEITESEEFSEDEQSADEIEKDAERQEGAEGHGRRRRRRRRRGRHSEGRETARTDQEAPTEQPLAQEDDLEEPAEDKHEEDQPFAAEPQGHETAEDGESGEQPRRRRRGRRGGRRGRRGREGETPFPDLENGHTSIEPELFEAVEDFSGSPPPDTEIAPSPEPPPVAPVAAPPEQPRRGSTVREPAPVASSLLEPMPSMTPTAPPPNPRAGSEEPKAQDSSPPRKTGWWSKRLAGGGNG